MCVCVSVSPLRHGHMAICKIRHKDCFEKTHERDNDHRERAAVGVFGVFVYMMSSSSGYYGKLRLV